MNLKTFQTQTDLAKKYDAVPLEAIFKQDILRLGVNFSADSIRIASGFKPKDYFIFSFDLLTLEEMESDAEHLLKAPEEVRFFGGPFELAPTIFSVRLNPKSPYIVTVEEGKLVLTYNGALFAEVEYHPSPVFYDDVVPSGKKVKEIAPILEWGYLIYLTVYRLCQYWGKDEECAFCDINENYRQQKNAGREYTGVKDPKDIVEALKLIQSKDNTAKAITITGGSITSKIQGESELEFYLKYARAIFEAFGDHWIIKAVVEAFEKEDCQRLHDEGGVQIYHPNYEIWNRELFAKICPGKERFVGYDTWMKRIVDSAEVFGPSHVIPNFVGGVEMSQPVGYTDFKEAVASTVEGLNFFMSQGILPRFTTWCPEPLAHLKDQQPASLEYYAHLLQEYKACVTRHNIKAPPGYGPPGKGKAVFSVSAFMDVLDP